MCVCSSCFVFNGKSAKDYLDTAFLNCEVHDAQINVGAVSPSELRAVSEKSLLLLAGIVADMEVCCSLSFIIKNHIVQSAYV